MPMHEADLDGGAFSHPVGVPADSGDVLGPDPNSPTEIALHLDNGDIRCGTCHNPHNDDSGTKYMRASTEDAELCGECHAEGAEWEQAGHSDRYSEAFTYSHVVGNTTCAHCHSGLGYIDFSNGVEQSERRADEHVHSCFVCHGPHGVANDALLRVFDEVTLPGDIVVTDAGASATCMVCHNGRRAPGGSSLTPHYALGGAMLEGVNGAEFGATIPSSPHTTLANCIVCHMAPGPAEGNPGAGLIGGHTFEMAAMVDDVDVENFQNSCNTAACHGYVGGIASPVLLLDGFDRPAFGDYDGDGETNGVQAEVESLLVMVFDEIHVKGGLFLGHYPYWQTKKCAGGIDDGEFCTYDSDCDLSAPDDGLGTCAAGPDEALLRDAIWNYEFVDNDGSLGVHNTGYAVGLLQVTYKALTGVDVPGAFLRYDAETFPLSNTNVVITQVNGGATVLAGDTLTVDFTIKDDAGDPIDKADLNRLRLYVSGPTVNYQRVAEADSDLTHFVQNVDGSYTYTAGAVFPSVYLPPVNDSPYYGPADGEWAGDPLIDGTYTVLIESRRVFGSIRKAGDATFDFVYGSGTLAPQQVVLQDNCNNCHLDLQLHGSNRYAVAGCVVCHTVGSEDRIPEPADPPVNPTTGVTVELGDMIHRIHRGHGLPSIAATANGIDPYRYVVIGYHDSEHDFSDIGFPVIPNAISECDACHGGAAQGGQIYTNITRANCRGCHEDLDYTTGTILDESHPSVDDGLLTVADLSDPTYRTTPGGVTHAFVDDTTCFGCHGPTGTYAIEALHQHSTDPNREGTQLTVDIISVGGMSGGGGTYFVAGDYPEVTFKLSDSGNDPLALPITTDSTVVDRLAVGISGPTTLYQNIIPVQRFWSSGWINVPPANLLDNLDGTYTFISEDPFPADYPPVDNASDPVQFPFEEGWG
ncbi:MAG: hypothetical protein JSU86_06460, partial [Phycisphaerales bacterium]